MIQNSRIKNMDKRYILQYNNYAEKREKIVYLVRVIIPNVIRLPGDTLTEAPGGSRFLSMNVPLVLSKSVTTRFPPLFWMRACRADTVQISMTLTREVKSWLKKFTDRLNQHLLQLESPCLPYRGGGQQ